MRGDDPVRRQLVGEEVLSDVGDSEHGPDQRQAQHHRPCGDGLIRSVGASGSTMTSRCCASTKSTNVPRPIHP